MADKEFYKIGEACKSLDIQPYVLRYWETEFPLLKSDATQSGQRVYSKDDLAVIRRIKELLYDEGFTIAGAKKKLEAERDDGLQLTLDAASAPAAKPAAKKKAEPKPAAGKPAPKTKAEPAQPKAEAKSKPAAEEPKVEKKAEAAGKAEATAPAKAVKKPSKTKTTKKAAKPAAKTEEPDNQAAALAEAQTEARETKKRAQKLERGIRSALDEARAILSILEADPADKQPSAKK